MSHPNHGEGHFFFFKSKNHILTIPRTIFEFCPITFFFNDIFIKDTNVLLQPPLMLKTTNFVILVVRNSEDSA